MFDKKTKLKKRRTQSFQIMILGFFALIVLGALLLMLPISSKDGTVTSFADTMFTALSATCVTGLIVQDTATHWSIFGQCIIILLIQIGGMGVITVAIAITMISGKKIGLKQRSAMQDAISAPHLGGILRFTSFILRTSFVIEFIGAVLLMPVFIKDMLNLHFLTNLKP